MLNSVAKINISLTYSKTKLILEFQYKELYRFLSMPEKGINEQNSSTRLQPLRHLNMILLYSLRLGVSLYRFYEERQEAKRGYR